MAKRICMFIVLLFVMEMVYIPLASSASTTDGQSVYRKRRFLFGWFGGPGPRCGGPGDCPPHHCRLDPAVIHGFCCGCARYNDRVPIPCPGNLQCPLSPQPLCSDYDYMMDCCC